MAILNTGFPCRRIARLEHGFAAILAQNDLALEHIDQLVFLLVPVALRGGCAWLQRTDIDAEMRKSCGPRQPFARAPIHRLVEGRRVSGRGIDRDLVDVDLRHQTRSIMVAVPMPTPMQSVTSAVSLSRRSSSSTTVPKIIAPVAPSGWPMAMAPPHTLSFSSGIFRSFWYLSTTDANASLSSNRSTSSALRPLIARSFSVAGVGPVSMIVGSLPLVAAPTMRAR